MEEGPFEPWTSPWKILMSFELQGSWTIDTNILKNSFRNLEEKLNSLHSHTFFSFDNYSLGIEQAA